jgi:hypothetical protein
MKSLRVAQVLGFWPTKNCFIPVVKIKNDFFWTDLVPNKISSLRKIHLCQGQFVFKTRTGLVFHMFPYVLPVKIYAFFRH